ncbi:MAG: hypothetical protein A2516_08145 [Alphaproteobacteria bacterium RIFOXYD12_FULL_60_8]|nr:MAG: hypothetical protein A2516_08145 [Alphaproteobacteria bacterium RIFOXYD12_FULL_60_8]
MRVRLTQLDGKLPNIALMRLAAYHRSKGDDVVFTHRASRDLLDGDFDRVYGSAIFTMSAPAIDRFLTDWPSAIIGGSGTDSHMTVESITGHDHQGMDYSMYPDFQTSIGFTQRGCRMRCRFCVVPSKEGKNRSVASVWDIWRGDPFPKKLHLLDNDFFGQEHWRARIAEIRDGGFKVCLNQGVNVRLIDDEAAEALASVEYRDDQFQERRVYTAWDSLGDEAVFLRGIARLEKAGIPPNHVMAYMLVGYDPRETWDRIFHRFNVMVVNGIKPYPMVFDPTRKDLKRFQRWVVTGLYRVVKWNDYDTAVSRDKTNFSFEFGGAAQ